MHQKHTCLYALSIREVGAIAAIIVTGPEVVYSSSLKYSSRLSPNIDKGSDTSAGAGTSRKVVAERGIRLRVDVRVDRDTDAWLLRCKQILYKSVKFDFSMLKFTL